MVIVKNNHHVHFKLCKQMSDSLSVYILTKGGKYMFCCLGVVYTVPIRKENVVLKKLDSLISVSSDLEKKG